MALVGLELLKKHLRVFHDDEDAELEVYLAAAETIVTEYVDREIVATGAENREPDMKAEGNAVLPRHVRALLAPYRVWRAGQ